MKRIGFLGGSFDPIHNGHLHLAARLKEYFNLDKILFSPAGCSPFKMDQRPKATPSQRLEMVRLAIEGVPFFEAVDNEVFKEGPSYTIDAIRELIQTEEKASYHLLLGEDVLSHLHLWKEYPSLLQLAPPLIGRRLKTPPDLSHFSPEERELIQKGFAPIPVVEISGTEIRNRLAEGLYIGDMVPAKVLDFIVEHRLY